MSVEKDAEIVILKAKLALAEEKIKKLEREASDASWVTNPDRMGGAFTDQEIQDSTTWK